MNGDAHQKITLSLTGIKFLPAVGLNIPFAYACRLPDKFRVLSANDASKPIILQSAFSGFCILLPAPGNSQRLFLISCFFSFPLHDGYIPAASVSPGQVTGKHLAPCSGSERLIGR